MWNWKHDNSRNNKSNSRREKLKPQWPTRWRRIRNSRCWEVILRGYVSIRATWKGRGRSVKILPADRGDAEEECIKWDRKKKRNRTPKTAQDEGKSIDEEHTKVLEMLLRESVEEWINKEKESIVQKEEHKGCIRNKEIRANKNGHFMSSWKSKVKEQE